MRLNVRRVWQVAFLLVAFYCSAAVLAGPLLSEKSQLPNVSAVAEAQFNVAGVSSNGELALAIAKDEQNCWSASVYSRSGSTWSFQKKVPAPEQHLFYCPRVQGGLSGDGSTFVIVDSGLDCAYVFVAKGTDWQLQAKLTFPQPPTSPHTAVALSQDGSTALVGAAADVDCVGAQCGGAYVFVRSGSAWALQQELHSPAVSGGQHFFGRSASLSADGNTALIGSGREIVGGKADGRAYVYARSGTTWALQQSFSAPDPYPPLSDYTRFFGATVALSGDGQWAIVGAPTNAYFGNTEERGAAYVYARSGNNWAAPQKLVEGGASFGTDVALSAGGLTAFVSWPWDAMHGVVAHFQRSGNTWMKMQSLHASDAELDDQFGNGLAVSSNANRLLVGAPGNNCGYGYGTPNCGAVYDFAPASPSEPRCVIDGPVFPRCLIDHALPPQWVPVGCEVVDCCPLCPAQLVIDWEIRVDGDPAEFVILRFENLNPAARRKLQIGNARWLEGDRLQIPGRGVTNIRGFSARGGDALIASMHAPRMTLERVVPPKSGTSSPRAVDAVDASRQGIGAIRVRVEQRVGNLAISGSTLVFRYQR